MPKIGIVMALDGERAVIDGLKNAKKETSLLQSELKKLSSEFEGSANSMEALTAKQNKLTDIQQSYSKQLELSKKGLNQASQNYKEAQKRVEELREAQEKAQKTLKEMQDSGKEGTSEYKKQESAVNALNKAVEKQESEISKCGGAMTDFRKKITEAETGIKKTDNELQKNAQYLDEAARSADGCATSIDRFGNEAKEAAQVTTSLGEKLKTAMVTKGIDLATDGVRKIADVAVDAAKAAVEVGSSFEASMSQVAAVSGASGAELEALTEKAKEMGAKTKFSATESAEAFNYMAMAGWKTSDMISGIDGIMALAAASGADLATTSDIVTDALTAMGYSAGDAGHLADVMAAASSNANTNVEMMGATFQYAAPIVGALGYNMEDTAVAIGMMANAGIKGEKAGTALRSILTRLAAPPKDCAEQMEKFGISITDASGKTRPLMEIMEDLRDRFGELGESEQTQAAKAIAGQQAMSGLLAIVNGSESDFEKLCEAIDNSSGAAENMANTMQDNLQGKLTIMGSALEGLGIAAYDYVKGPLSGVVEGVTGVISGITDAITPQKSELEQFVDDIKASNDQVRQMIDNAQNLMSGSDADVASLEAYRDVILSLNDVEEKDAFQKYQMKNAVDALSQSIPELSAAFNEQTGTIEMSADAINQLFDAQRNLIIQNAMLEANKEAMEGAAQAALNMSKADAAMKAAKEQAADAERKYKEELAATGNEMNDYYTAYLDGQVAVEDATKAQEEASRTFEDATQVAKESQDAVEGATEALKEHGIIAEDAASKEEELGNSLDGAAQEFDEYGNNITGMSEEMAAAVTKATGEIITSYQNMRESVQSAVEGSISLFNEFSGGTETSAEEINKNLQSQIDGITQWKENMETLAGQIGEGMSQELYDTLAQMGPEQGANAVQTLVNALESDSGQFEEISQHWGELLQLKDDSASVAANTSAGKAMADAINTGFTEGLEQFPELGKNASDKVAEGITEGADTVKEATGEMVSNAAAEADTDSARVTGEKIDEAVASGISDSASTVSDAVRDTVTEAASVAGDHASEFRKTGLKSGEAVADGIKGAAKIVNSAIGELLKPNGADIDGFKQIGTNISKNVASGVTSSNKNVVEATKNTMVASLNTLISGAAQYNKVGQNFGAQITTGLAANQSNVASAAQALASVGVSGASGQRGGFYSAGVNLSAGLASGISAGGSSAINAAANVAAQALAAAKARLDIHSPSRKFRDEVGKQIGAGMALGIKDSASLAGREATKMSAQVYKNATAWLNKYRKNHEISLADEKYYWEQVAQHVKKGTDAYKKAQNELKKLKSSDTITKALSSQIDKNFGVSKTTKKGSGKKTATETKSTEKYMSEVVTAAEKQLKRYQTLHATSLRQEENYWKNIRKKIEQGGGKSTDAYYTVTKKIKELSTKIREEEEKANNEKLSAAEDYLKKRNSINEVSLRNELKYWNKIKKTLKVGTDAWYSAVNKIAAIRKQLGTLDTAEKMLSTYKEYFEVSAQAEVEYWDKVRNLYKEGTDERIEADKKYFAAKKDLNDRLKDLDQDYLDKTNEINDKLAESIDELNEKYDDAVKSRAESIAGAFGLFDAFESESPMPDELLFNIKSQAAGYEDWSKTLDELAGRGKLSDKLLQELQEQGPQISAQIHALNMMTDEQLAEFQEAYDKKQKVAEERAKKENEALLKSIEDEKVTLKAQAEKDKTELTRTYNANYADLTSSMSSELNRLANKVSGTFSDEVGKVITEIRGLSTSGLASGSASGNKDVVSVIESTGTARNKKLSAADKAKHADPWEYIVSNYGYSPSVDTYKQLGALLGVKTTGNVTQAQREEILQLLKKRGYASGGTISRSGYAWKDEFGIEAIIRRSDNAKLKPVQAGDLIVTADDTARLARWGNYDADAAFSAIEAIKDQALKTQSQMSEMIANMNAMGGIAALNHLMDTGMPTPTQTTDLSQMENMMGQMMSIMSQFLPYLAQNTEIRMDTGALVGALQKDMSNALAADSNRRRRR